MMNFKIGQTVECVDAGKSGAVEAGLLVKGSKYKITEASSWWIKVDGIDVELNTCRFVGFEGDIKANTEMELNKFNKLKSEFLKDHQIKKRVELWSIVFDDNQKVWKSHKSGAIKALEFVEGAWYMFLKSKGLDGK